MFAYIKGRLEYKQNDFLVIDVNGVGYKVHTALSTIENSGNLGDVVKVHTYMHLREDIMCLYGFITLEELSMFEMLISVSGVGPKAAVSVISSVSPSKFGLAVITDDAKTLTKAPGIGNKTAQRIILELKDKMKKEQIAAINLRDEEGPAAGEVNKAQEAVSALMVLGYNQAEAARAVSSVYSEDLELEAVIKAALKNLVRLG